jgi:fluoride exporter
VERVVIDVVLVGAAGAAGAVSRHLLDVVLKRSAGPGPSLGVLLANVVGSLVVGVIAGAAFTSGVDQQLRLVVATGFCGAFTTFSTLMAEIVQLLEGEGERGGAVPGLAWAVVSVVGGVGAAAIGWAVGSG